MEERKLFIFCVATSKEPEAYGKPRAPPTSQIPLQSWVEVSPAAGTEPALLYQQGSVSQGRGQRVSQSIWSRPTNSERCLKKRADQGKMAAKLIWERANLSSGSPFEMKSCLVASLPAGEISLVLLEGMCECLCVSYTVRECFNNMASERLCVRVCRHSNFREKGVMTLRLLPG